MDDQMEWTIGELASAAGVTVRTLHHYDRVGLLVPDDRSLGGHRRYAANAVERLYRIVALRGLGFGLAEIAAMLDADRGQLIETVRQQFQAVDAEVEARKRLRDQLARMLGRLERNESLSAAELIETMEEISMSIRIDRVYTRAGDDGETELVDGTWIAKTDAQLEAGDIEELSAHIGVAAASGELLQQHATSLAAVQNDLFDIGAELARGAQAHKDTLPRVSSAYVDWLEARCDEANRELPPLESFVLPGGTALAAQLHVCRTVCRRIERRVLARGGVNPEIGRYLNRLSDLLFILARSAAGNSERLWEPGKRTRDGRG